MTSENLEQHLRDTETLEGKAGGKTDFLRKIAPFLHVCGFNRCGRPERIK